MKVVITEDIFLLLRVKKPTGFFRNSSPLCLSMVALFHSSVSSLQIHSLQPLNSRSFPNFPCWLIPSRNFVLYVSTFSKLLLYQFWMTRHIVQVLLHMFSAAYALSFPSTYFNFQLWFISFAISDNYMWALILRQCTNLCF